MRLCRRAPWLLSSALVLGAATAEANGRFPFAAQLVVDPLDSTHLVVRTTYGPLQSIDEGRTWRWICERSVGYAGIFDPSLAIAEGGVLFGLSYALARSDDRACTFAHVPGDIDARYVVDLAVARDDPAHVIAVATPTEPGVPGAASFFFDSRDGGRFFLRFGEALPADVVPETIELAPSRPSRVYLSGKGPAPLGVVLRSDDGGATWERSSFDLAGAKAPYLAAVDPEDPDRIFVRLDHEPGDRLVVSNDGGRTFVEAFSGVGKLYGFALSPDGRRVAIGGPNDGILTADSHALAFEKTSDVPARCLAWSSAGLWACVDETPSTFSTGLSTDEGRTFVRRSRLRDVSPLVCAAGTTTGDRCPEDWPAVETLLGIGDAGADAADASAVSDAEPVAPEPAPDPGCACDARGADRRGAPWWPIVVAVALVSRWRPARRPAAARSLADN